VAIVANADDDTSLKDKMLVAAVFFLAIWIWTKEGSMLAGSIFFLMIAAIIQWPGASAVAVFSVALLAGATWIGWKALQVFMAIIAWIWGGLIAASRVAYEILSFAIQSMTAFVSTHFVVIIVSSIALLALYLFVQRIDSGDG
jgi:hypothetical protein